MRNSNVRRTTLGFEKDTEVVLSQDITEIRAVFDDICQTMDTEHYQQVCFLVARAMILTLYIDFVLINLT